METLDSALWQSSFSPQRDDAGAECRDLAGEDGYLRMPLAVDGFSVYRFRVTVKNVDGNGRLYFDICVDGCAAFPQTTLCCPQDPHAWHVFEIDVTTGRCPKRAPAVFRISRAPHGTGTVLVNETAFEKLPKGVGPNPEPRLLGCERLDVFQDMDDQEFLDIEQYTVAMEADMDEFDQQVWRGKHVIAKRDERGVKCQSMDGDKSIIFVPVKVEPNATYRLHLDLKRETGNGKLFCNFYANRSFDFPHVTLVCENSGWGIFDLQVQTESFPPSLPIVLRLWRSPGGTGSLLVKRIAIERLPVGTAPEEPRMVASSSIERMVAAQPEPAQEPRSTSRRRHIVRTVKSEDQSRRPPAKTAQAPNANATLSSGLSYSCFTRQPTRVFFVSELDDDAAMRAAFETIGLRCEALTLAGDAPRLPDLVSNRGGNWIHFHLRRNTEVTADIINQVRNVRPDAIVTAWVEPGWPLFDSALVPVLRAVDLALMESDLEVATYRAAGCFGAELWDPGFDLPESASDSAEQDVAILFDSPADEDLATACARQLGPRAAIADLGSRQILLAGAKVAVFAGSRPSRALFWLLATGVPVLARRSMECAEWCEDGKDLLFFDTPEECAALAAALMDDSSQAQTLGERGRNLAGFHTRASRAKELAVRLGLHEVVLPNLPANRSFYAFRRGMCLMRAVPVDLVGIRSNAHACLTTLPFTSCRDLTAKIVRFAPDFLHIHLDPEDVGLPWRELLLDLRRRMPDMLVTAWHPGERDIDKRMMDLRFSADHLLIGSAGTLPRYHEASLVGTEVWNPGTTPGRSPEAFREALFSLMRGMGERRRLFLVSADGNEVDLTVFIGTYNRLDQLKRAVETALSSAGLRRVEVIVNDAGSTDGTQQWLSRMACADGRVVPIFSGRRTSFTQAFNESLQIAKGRYICWLSDDIISEGNALSDMCDIMNELAPADMGGFCVRNSWSHEYTVRQDAGFHFPTVGCMYTETLRKMNGINMDYPYYAQDTELDMRVLRLGGRIVACEGCKLLHDCRNDGLRVSNSHNHTRTMGDLKFLLAAWHPGESSRFPYPTILLVPVRGCGPSDIMRTVHAIRAQYSNAHLFVGGEASEQLDVSGQNSFLCKIPIAHGKAAAAFNLVIEVGPDKSVLVKPADKASTPFVGKMLVG